MTDRPWFANYDKGVPKTIDYPKEPLYLLLGRVSEKVSRQSHVRSSRGQSSHTKR